MNQKITLKLDRNGDFTPSDGRDFAGMNPKEMLLCAAARCAGLTTLKIMHAERLKPLRLEIACQGELSTETLRAESVFRTFHVSYNVACATEAGQEKAGRAVALAHENYCGLLQMLRRIAPVTHEVAVVVTQEAEA